VTDKTAAVDPRLYEFLAEVYQGELNRDAVARLSQILASIPPVADANQAQPLRLLEQTLEQIAAEPEKQLLLLGIEYTNLFRGTGPRPVYLYEAVQRSEEGLMYEGPYFEVRACYETTGFAAAAGTAPEDHLAVELRYVSFLDGQIEQARAQQDFDQETWIKAQRESFLREHLLQWVPPCSAALMANAELAFYRQAGELTQAVCAQLYTQINAPAENG
jgi:TorA maturation chaperone TorD